MFDLFELSLWQYTDTNEWLVEPDVKPAAVMNHSTLEGVIHFYEPF